MNKTDKKILNSIRKGGPQVFEELFRIYYNRLILYAASYMEEDNIAEDIVQEVFFNLWKRRKEIIITVSISSYLFRAVHNRCLQFLRHKKVESTYETKYQLKLKEAEIHTNHGSDYIFSEIQFNEIQNIINQTFNSLPEKSKNIFKLSRENENSNQKIAELLDINIKTVEYHISKTLRVLRTALRDYFLV